MTWCVRLFGFKPLQAANCKIENIYALLLHDEPRVAIKREKSVLETIRSECRLELRVHVATLSMGSFVDFTIWLWQADFILLPITVYWSRFFRSRSFLFRFDPG